MNAEYIQDETALRRLCQQMRGAPWIALDTEFLRSRTYYAHLCLIQVATPDVVACVDPLVHDLDIDPLLNLIHSPKILKVFHSARQDLEVFHDLRQVAPQPLFDTQIAAALAGYDDQIGYAALVESITGVKLAKQHTRTDWKARPLTPEQIRYAEDDVRHLREVYVYLAERLSALGRKEWLEEECAALADPALYRNEPEQAYRRIRQGHLLPPEAQTVLSELAAWRENTAQKKNLPRSWVMADAALLEVARTAPGNLEQLAEMKGVSIGNASKWGPQILEAVRAGQNMPPRRLWNGSRPLDRHQQALYARMAARVRQVAQEQKIHPGMIARRKDIQELILDGDSGPLARGWRRRLVGEELRSMRNASRIPEPVRAG
ncbi:MAG: ribonuclease D [Gammaproteobacteria bacterium]|nr:MAG: ribonuclease D [Gammaproteobacteria bacterium]